MSLDEPFVQFEMLQYVSFVDVGGLYPEMQVLLPESVLVRFQHDTVHVGVFQ